MKKAAGLAELLIVILFTLILIVVGMNMTKKKTPQFTSIPDKNTIEQTKDINVQLQELQKAKDLHNQRQLELMNEMR